MCAVEMPGAVQGRVQTQGMSWIWLLAVVSLSAAHRNLLCRLG